MKVAAPARLAPRAPVRRAAPARPSGNALAARTAAFASLGAQPALMVGAVNDPLEREAEANAERVAAGATATVAGAEAPPPQAPKTGQPARREGLGGQPSLDALEQSPSMPETMQETSVPAQNDVDTGKLDAADMQEIQSGGDGADAGAEADDAAASKPVQTDRVGLAPVAVGPEGGAAPADVAGRVEAPGSGRPLPADIRSDMERGFDADFSHVRLHDSGRDRQDAARLGARAFTHGRHVWLGPGEALSDRRLLAHELTHVVQQTGRRRPLAARRAALMASAAPIRRGWMADEAESYARQIPGYPLLCVLLGKSPITDKEVPRNAENMIGGLMSLVPGGNVLFEQLQKANVITDALDWVTGKLTDLDLSWARLERVVSKAIDDFSVTSPIESLKPAFRPLFDDIATFAIAVKDKVVELIIKGALKLAGPYAEQVFEIIGSAKEAFKLIVDNPLGFAQNLIRAVVQGFKKFGSNIGDHLKRGLLGWLFGAIEGADIKMPAQLDLKGVLSIGFQLLGLTWERWRKKIVKKLDPHGELKVKVVEKAVDFIRILVTEGFAGVWQRMLAFIDGFKQTVVEGIKGFVTSSIIQAGISWLAGLSNPVGAIIKLAMTIYDMIVVFLERLQQILDVAKSIFSSINAIAKGNVDAAADKVEETIGRTVPVVISFVAGLLKLNGISAKIKEIIKKLRTPVDKALDKLINFVIKKVKALFSKLISKLNKKRKLPSVSFQFGDAQHRIYARKKGKKAEVMIASEATPASEVDDKLATEVAHIEDPKAKTAAKGAVSEVKDADKETKAPAEKIDLASQKENQRGGLEALELELKEAAEALTAQGETLKQYPEIETKGAPYLFRAKEPRYPAIEGKAGRYAERMKETQGKIEPDGGGKTYSIYYENDHIPEKQFAKAILANIDKFKPGAASGGVADRATDKTDQPPQKQEEGKPAVGEIGLSITKIDDNAKEFPAVTTYRPVHLSKGATPAATATKMVQDAANAAGPGGPVAAIKQTIRAQIQTEADKTAAIVRQDASAPPEIKAKVDEGLKTVSTLGAAIYGLDEAAKPQAANAPADPAAQTDLSALPFTGDGAGKPDFTKVEGAYQPYASRESGFGAYIEYDHIIESGWPLQAQDLSFGEDRFRSVVSERIKGEGNDAKSPEASDRLSALAKKRVFPANHKVAKYTQEAGMTVGLYRPIHRVVTAGVKKPNRGRIIAGIGDRFAEPLTAYVRTGDLTKLDEARKAVQDNVKETFDAASAEHTDAVADQYASELRKAEAVNPGHKDDAKRAMTAITGKVAGSLRAARNDTRSMFG
ncbi:DUF4157 domain-containing protein [Methylopila sp. M107]|uniref:eCIS core domain-containing protein n=1 Tax=Methylopila sp. M107 TaxID=1101190 RepID=UPI000368754A|nr:DUF4157 domain-containing protein [Methylopila sp. M107]